MDNLTGQVFQYVVDRSLQGSAAGHLIRLQDCRCVISEPLLKLWTPVFLPLRNVAQNCPGKRLIRRKVLKQKALLRCTCCQWCASARLAVPGNTWAVLPLAARERQEESR
jgi:hypothetical protein